MYTTRIKTILAGFGRREDGTISLEAMIILPLMFWAFLSVFSIFHSYRTYTINQKAAFTIGDAISRETAPLDDDYITGMLGLFEYLSRSEGNSTLRITSLHYDGPDDNYRVDWSKVRGSRPELIDEDVREWSTKLPVMPDGERVMLVETWSTYDPPFATGLEQREIRNFVFTRPRFAPRVCWDECN